MRIKKSRRRRTAPTGRRRFVKGAFFSPRNKTPYDPRSWRLELDNQEKRKARYRRDRHKTGWRSGVLCRIAEPNYDPSGWRLELDQESGRRRTAPIGIRRFVKGAFFSPRNKTPYDPRSWRLELDPQKHKTLLPAHLCKQECFVLSVFTDI